ncbi:ubiquitin carboxyl-terminal hydrolase 15-like [Thrips palmi]|uniref:ubiquitinyl hydrolase 1 n=1 Tax=Thrips palmi TaxID=161013 RepID=A0A6P8YNU5_THRPL|nr:ubiquitin carboxyl-terminal hydrolase 15-like [Thrips palmi]XP_034238541.1 ubiquitin carboxyl-terminal hydrolase 15-like [Thrips palmi]
MDCFKLFCEENRGPCEKCKGVATYKSIVRFGRLPPVLVIQLKRYGPTLYGFFKNNSEVLYDHNIDLAEFAIDSAQTNTEYSLFAVTSHTGQMGAGHVIAACLRNNRWYNFDDEHVSSTSAKRVVSNSAYLLWYQLELKVDSGTHPFDAETAAIIKNLNQPSSKNTSKNISKNKGDQQQLPGKSAQRPVPPKKKFEKENPTHTCTGSSHFGGC